MASHSFIDGMKNENVHERMSQIQHEIVLVACNLCDKYFHLFHITQTYDVYRRDAIRHSPNLTVCT